MINCRVVRNNVFWLEGGTRAKCIIGTNNRSSQKLAYLPSLLLALYKLSIPLVNLHVGSITPRTDQGQDSCWLHCPDSKS